MLKSDDFSMKLHSYGPTFVKKLNLLILYAIFIYVYNIVVFLTPGTVVYFSTIFTGVPKFRDARPPISAHAIGSNIVLKLYIRVFLHGFSPEQCQ